MQWRKKEVPPTEGIIPQQSEQLRILQEEDGAAKRPVRSKGCNLSWETFWNSLTQRGDKEQRCIGLKMGIKILSFFMNVLNMGIRWPFGLQDPRVKIEKDSAFVG
jgi:hypothetical protein